MQHVFPAALQLKVCVGEQLAGADGDAEVFDDDLLVSN